MFTSPRFQRLLTLAMLVAFAGCSPPRFGEPRFTIEVDGIAMEATVIDFGVVPRGKRVEKVVTVTNRGPGALQLNGFVKDGEGPVVQLGTSIIEPEPVFGVDLEPIVLFPGDAKALTFFFQPPLHASTSRVVHAVTLTTAARNVSQDAPAVQVALKGESTLITCDVPPHFDFGAVSRGDTFELALSLKNPTSVSRQARIGELRSASEDSVFTLTSDSPRGDFTLAPGSERTVRFVFAPTQVRHSTATIALQLGDECPDVTARLVGTGVDSVLTSSQPEGLDFGYVEPGVLVTTRLTFFNRSFKPVELRNLVATEGTNLSSVYRVTAASPGDVTRLTVPAGSRDPATDDLLPGAASVTLSFQPRVVGPQNATLVADTDLSAQPALSVPLRAVGGGPAIEVVPWQILNVGRIEFFPGVGAAATGTLTVRNVGTAPAVPDSRANLRLGARGAGPPYWTVTPKNEESALDEICVGAFDALSRTCLNDLPAGSRYDPAVGLSTAGADLEIPLRVQPKNLSVNSVSGDKAWEVVIFSNDPGLPELRTTVTARPVSVPPCEYTVTPQSLDFGTVSGLSPRSLSFQLCNVAPLTATANTCLVSNPIIEAGSSPVFSLPFGSGGRRELRPQQCERIHVRVLPMALPATPTTVTGRVAFSISSDDLLRANPRVLLAADLVP
ncbi:MAG: hypothetical protein SFW67_03985 [Myxococcaceae bacterium]|nr:hypothetical protein [Myxococcaceae bacterium]